MTTHLSARIVVLGLVGSLFWIAGCGSDGGTEPEPNLDPMANVSVADATVDVGTEVVLDASGSSDPDGDPLTYSWILNAPAGSNAQLSDASAQQPRFTPDVEGDYTATVTVDDGNGGSDDATVWVLAELGVIIVDSDITTNTTWVSGSIVRVTAAVAVNGAVLTIEPDVRVEFEEDAGLFVRGGSSQLLANGDASTPILMTGTSEVAGHWLGLGFAPNSSTHELHHVEIAYGGQAGSPWTDIDQAAAVALDQDVDVEVRNTTIRDSEAFGLYADDGAGLPGFESNAFSANAAGSAYLPSTLMAALDTGTTFDDGDPATPSAVRIYEVGDFDVATTIPAIDVPFQIDDADVLVAAAELTISGGTIIEFGEAAGLYIDGDATLDINGEAGSIVQLRGTDPTPGYWWGIGFDPNTNRHELDYVEIAGAGRAGTPWSNIAGTGALALDRDVEVQIRQSTIRDSETFGLYAENGAGLPGFENNVFAGNLGASAYLPSTLMDALDGGSTFDDGDPATPSVVRIYKAGDFESATTIPALDVAYRVDDAAVLRADAEFTIAPGTTIEFGEAAGLYVSGSGTLAVNGESGSMVVLTGTQETPGHWKGIGFDTSPVRHVIRHTVIEYGGNPDPHFGLDRSANIAIEENVLDLRNSTVRHSGAYGLYVELEGSTLPDFSANLFAQNTEAPMYIRPSQMIAIDGASDFTNNAAPHILVDDGDTSVDGTISALLGDVPYRIEAADVIRFRGDVTLEGGVEIEFEEAAGFFFRNTSKLVANGTTTERVLLTSAAESPAPGDWAGVVFDSNPLSHDLTYLTIEYAGGGTMSDVNGQGNLRLDVDTTLNLTNCTIRQSAGYGIWRDATSSVVNETDTSFSDNASGAMNTP